MAILDFMPKFAPWYTKTLLKKEDEPATDPSTGFFGDVFNFIDDAFTWPANPEPVEPDWGGASLGAGFGEQAPAYEPYIEPDYSGMGDPFGMTDPFTEEEWVSAPSTPPPSAFSGPILGGMFGSAAPYAPVPPDTGGFFGSIGEMIDGSGEGLGFDLIEEPTQSWAGYAPPPPASFAGGIAGGMFGSEPTPTSYPDISAQWQDTDWVSAPPRESFGDNFGMDFRGRLDASLGERDPWADVQNWEGMPAPSADTSEWNQLAPDLGSNWGGAGLGAGLGIDMSSVPEPFGGDWAGGVRGAGVTAPDYDLSLDNWSMAPTPDDTLSTGGTFVPQNWDTMSPREKGEFVYFSGLRGDDYLSETDYKNMPVDLAQKIGYADSRIEGGINNGFSSILKTLETPFNAAYETIGDAVVDPILTPLDSTGNIISPFQKDFWSKGPSLSFGTDTLDEAEFAIPLEDTVQNAQDASDPWGFLEAQNDAFKDRPMAQQFGIPILTPGSGIYKNATNVPGWIRGIDSTVDLIQGGELLDNIGTIPGMSSAMKNVVVPGAVGGTGGALTEAIFDPTYSDQWGNEYDPGYLEMILGGAGLGIGGRQALKSGTVPFGASIEDVTKNFPVVPGSPKYGLPNVKGAPKKEPVSLIWEDPLDKALYQATSTGTAKTKPAVIALLKENGLDDADIAAGGARVRARLKELTTSFKGGETIQVPKIARPDVTGSLDETFGLPNTISQMDEIETPGMDAVMRDLRDQVTPATVTDVTTSVTPPVTTSAPLVDKVVAHIDLIKSAREMDAGAEKAALNQWQTALTREAQARLGNVRGLEEAAKQISNVRMATFAPGAVRLTPDEATLVLETALDKARKMGYGEPGDYAVRRAVDSLRDGTNAAPSELNLLRALLTDTPYDKATVDAIDSVVTPQPAVLGGATEPVTPGTITTADGVVMTAPPTPKAPKGIDPADIAPSPAVTPTPKFDPNDPLKGQVFKPSGIERTAFPESEAAIQPAMDVGVADPLKGRTPGSAPEPSVIPDTVAKPVQGTVLESVPKKHEERLNEWMAEMRQKTARMSEKERDSFLDKQQVKLAKLLRGEGESEAGRVAAIARDNVGKLATEDRAFANNAVHVAEIADWRKRYVPVLDKIELDKDISPLVRGRGRISNKMGDALTDYGDRLYLSLQNRGLTREEAMAEVEDEMSRYLNNRAADLVAKGDPDGLLRGTYTAIHTGPFKPKTPAGILPVETGTGEIPKALQITSDVAMEIKNSKFGLTDMAGIFANGALAVLRQGVPLTAAYTAKMANLLGANINLNKYLEGAENAGALFTKQTDAMDPGAGSVISRIAKIMGDGKLKPAGDVLRWVDQGPMAINKALETVQYDLVLNQALRKPAYQGNMLILDALSRFPVIGKYIDPMDPKTQEAVARMVNGATSAARPARDNTRRAIEGSSLTSARFTRAQLDFIAMAPRLFGLKNVPLEERAVIGMAVLSTAGALALAKETVGEELNLDWDDPENFGRLRIPNGDGGYMIMNLQPNTQAIKALSLSADAVRDFIEGENTQKDVQQKLSDAWIKYALGRSGPLATTGLNAVEVGFDPKENTWNYPGIPGFSEGKGDGWGDTMSGWEKFWRAGPFPVGGVDITADKLTGEEASTLSRIVNFVGAGAFDENDLTTTLRDEYGVENWQEFEALEPESYRSRKNDFYQRHPDLSSEETTLSEYPIAREKAGKEFMEDKSVKVGAWRDTNKAISAATGGVFNELGYEMKERPEKDGSDQWLWDYSQTFAAAVKDPEHPVLGMDMEVLGAEQAKFWAKHPDPKVRKEILAAQLAKAPTEADKLWIKDMARLNGFDPETGEQLKYPGGNVMPNYFEMDRYKWLEVPNDESSRFFEEFNTWKREQDEEIRAVDKEKLIKYYIATEPTYATREDGRKWDALAINDLVNYGRETQYTPVYKNYRKIMAPELMWFDQGQHWSNIEEAHIEAGRK